ncbi:hypothetical protein TNCT_123531 [Trichonephila clavata]|uniref:Uncharacterized protein n=1 Tax=Trichonephila clavata TaxID=2740835 RepID=A0A8X6H335_TRICU|nr:hypothetical protein TNCT_123531 [Trichonephila clavata]
MSWLIRETNSVADGVMNFKSSLEASFPAFFFRGHTPSYISERVIVRQGRNAGKAASPSDSADETFRGRLKETFFGGI